MQCFVVLFQLILYYLVSVNFCSLASSDFIDYFLIYFLSTYYLSLIYSIFIVKNFDLPIIIRIILVLSYQ